MRTRKHEAPYSVFDARARTIDVLGSLAEGSGDYKSIEEVAEMMRRAATLLGENFASRRYNQFTTLLDILHRLFRWGDAIRSAEIDADRYLRAARQSAKDLFRELDSDVGAFQFSEVLSMMNAIAEVEELREIARLMLYIPLPLPIFIERLNTAFRSPARGVVDDENDEKQIPAVSVAFVSFSLNESNFANPQTVEPDTLHDLGVEVRVFTWPEGAEKLLLDAVSVEPSDVYSLPEFEFTKPDGVPPYVLHKVGRMLIHVPQALFSRPLEFSYRARFMPEDSKIHVTVEGQRHLRVQSYDPEVNPLTGYREVDLRLQAIRQKARLYPGIRDGELGHFLQILGAIGRVAGQAIQDNLFNGDWTERQFQDKMKELLRSDPKIGSELEEHPTTAGGITDLSFHKIRIELKVHGTGYFTIENSLSFSSQVAQYVAGSDRRFGLLCVLDFSPKTASPGTVGNDIDLKAILPPEGKGPELPILLGIVIVRGNLARPSDLSH